MKIRLATEKEVKRLSQIVSKNYSPLYGKLAYKEILAMFKNYVMKPTYFVAEDEGKIKGFAGFIISRMDYRIYNIFWVNVDPEYQKQGIGTKLIEKILKTIKSYKGTFKAHMVMLTTNKPKFYERFGFRKIKGFKNDDCLMSLIFG